MKQLLFARICLPDHAHVSLHDTNLKGKLLSLHKFYYKAQIGIQC